MKELLSKNGCLNCSSLGNFCSALVSCLKYETDSIKEFWNWSHTTTISNCMVSRWTSTLRWSCSYIFNPIELISLALCPWAEALLKVTVYQRKAFVIQDLKFKKKKSEKMKEKSIRSSCHLLFLIFSKESLFCCSFYNFIIHCSL